MIDVKRAVVGIVGVLALLGAALTVPTDVSAATLTNAFGPVADAYVDAGRASTSYGTKTELKIRSAPLKRTYLRFSVGVPGPVRKATLRLYLRRSANAVINVRGVITNSWSETTITHANAPSMGAVVAGSSGQRPGGAYLSFDVSSLVTGNGPVSIGVTTSTSSDVKFASRESGAATAPQLVVEYETTTTTTGPTTTTTSPTTTTTSSPPPTTTPTTNPPSDPVIAAAGDIACNTNSSSASSCRHLATSNQLVGAGLSAVLQLGDLQYEAGELSNFNAFYNPSWGRVKAISYPAPGNHEYQTAGASGYYQYFADRAFTAAPGYYSYDIGAWHLIALNSNCSSSGVGGCGVGSAQEQWLRNDLATKSRPCTLAYWHHPRFSSGNSHGSNPITQPFWQALYDFNAEIVLNGHEHNYERFAPQTPAGAPDAARGIRELVVGTGGKGHYGFGSPIANSEVRNSTAFGVLKLTLHANSYDWEFESETGATLDSGTGACH